MPRDERAERIALRQIVVRELEARGMDADVGFVETSRDGTAMLFKALMREADDSSDEAQTGTASIFEVNRDTQRIQREAQLVVSPEELEALTEVVTQLFASGAPGRVTFIALTPDGRGMMFRVQRPTPRSAGEATSFDVTVDRSTRRILRALTSP